MFNIPWLKKKLNNASHGFTLVEIIIAVAILAVVTVPIMTALVQTAKINQKSRNLQKGTDLAQNLMEGISEYTMDEVIEQCLSLNEDGSGSDFKIIYSSIINYEPTAYECLDARNFESQLTSITNTATVYGEVDEDDYNPDTFFSAGSGVYNFAFMNIEYNQSKYDALVTFTKPTEYHVDINSGSGPVQNDTDTGTNKKYYTYNVTISIYNSVDGGHFKSVNRVTTLNGAIQNR